MAMPHVERLGRRVQNLVGPSEVVRAAFVVNSGSPAGSEAIGYFLGGLPVGLGIFGLRRFYTVAVTDQHVAVIRNRGESKPLVVERRLERSGALGPIEGSGDYKVAVDGVDYWIPLRWLDEARRAQRLSTC